MLFRRWFNTSERKKKNVDITSRYDTTNTYLNTMLSEEITTKTCFYWSLATENNFASWNLSFNITNVCHYASWRSPRLATFRKKILNRPNKFFSFHYYNSHSGRKTRRNRRYEFCWIIFLKVVYSNKNSDRKMHG